MRSATIAGNVYEVTSDGVTIILQEIAQLTKYGKRYGIVPRIGTTNRMRLPAATWREVLPLVQAELADHPRPQAPEPELVGSSHGA